MFSATLDFGAMPPWLGWPGFLAFVAFAGWLWVRAYDFVRVRFGLNSDRRSEWLAAVVLGFHLAPLMVLVLPALWIGQHRPVRAESGG